MQELANYGPQANVNKPSDFILPRTKNIFYLYKWLKTVKRIIFHAMWKLYEIQISVCINTVLLEGSLTHSCIVYGFFLATREATYKP